MKAALLALAVVALPAKAQLWGYVDGAGIAHVASEPLRAGLQSEAGSAVFGRCLRKTVRLSHQIPETGWRRAVFGRCFPSAACWDCPVRGSSASGRML